MEILGLVIPETTASNMMETRMYFLQTDITFTDWHFVAYHITDKIYKKLPVVVCHLENNQ